MGNGLGWFYSAPPVRLSSRGFGEASTAFTFGFLLPGMGYLAIAKGLDLPFLLAAVPLTLLGVTFILSVEIPDRDADALSGKMTFIVRHGTSVGLRMVLGSAALAAFLYLTSSITGVLPPGAPAGIFVLASLVPLASPLAAGIRPPRDRGGMAGFARRTVLSLILFAALVDGGLLFTIFRA